MLQLIQQFALALCQRTLLDASGRLRWLPGGAHERSISFAVPLSRWWAECCPLTYKPERLYDCLGVGTVTDPGPRRPGRAWALRGADTLGQEMDPEDPWPALEVPARRIPVPRSISKEAQAALGMGRLPALDFPSPGDVDGWRNWIAVRDGAMINARSAVWGSGHSRVEDLVIAGVPVFRITPPGVDPDDHRVYLEIHGGALVQGRGELCRLMGTYIAEKVGLAMWAVDFRMPPEHPYPAGLEDCLAVYKELLRDTPPHQLIVSGASAGATLAGALILRARDEGLPLPAAAVLVSPELDLTESGDSFETNMGIDTVLTTTLMPANLLYAGNHPLDHPYVSPLFGDFSKGFPPTFLSAGTRDLFLSNAARMHRALRRAGVWADLHIQEGAPHGGFMTGTPEDREIDAEVRRFVDQHCPVSYGNGSGSAD